MSPLGIRGTAAISRGRSFSSQRQKMTSRNPHVHTVSAGGARSVATPGVGHLGTAALLLSLGQSRSSPCAGGLWGLTDLESRAWGPTQSVGPEWGGHREGRALLKSRLPHQATELAPVPPAPAPSGSLGTAVQQPEEHPGTWGSKAQGRAGQAPPPLHQPSPDPSGCRPQLLGDSGWKTGRGGTRESKPERNEKRENVEALAGLAVELGEGARAARTLPAAMFMQFTCSVL